MKWVGSIVALGVVACGLANADQREDNTFGKVIEVPAKRPPLESDRVFAGNDQAVLSALRAYHERGPEDDESILVELEAAGLNNIAPPLLMEYARRQWSAGRDGWGANYGIARTRMMFDRMSCVDRSAGQFQAIIVMEFANHQDFVNAYSSRNLEQQKADMKAGLKEGGFFGGHASAWWICSHGMSNMLAAKDGRALTLEEWWVGEDQRAQVRAQGEAAMSGAFPD